MNHIKSYKIFESSYQLMSMIDIKDILLSLKDDGFKFEIIPSPIRSKDGHMIPFSPISDNSFYIGIDKGSIGVNLFNYDDIRSCLDHFISYMSDHGFVLVETNVRDSELKWHDINNVSDTDNIERITLKFNKID